VLFVARRGHSSLNFHLRGMHRVVDLPTLLLENHKGTIVRALAQHQKPEARRDMMQHALLLECGRLVRRRVDRHRQWQSPNSTLHFLWGRISRHLPKCLVEHLKVGGQLVVIYTHDQIRVIVARLEAETHAGSLPNERHGRRGGRGGVCPLWAGGRGQ
jgi:hypothetical protein